MKLLYLNNFYYARGGAENVLLNESDMMEKHGHSTHVFSRHHQDNLPSAFDDYFPRKMVTDNVKFNLRAINDFPKLFYNFQARNGLKRLLEKTSIDIAHAHNIYGGLTTSVLDVLKKRQLPTVMTLHDYKLICPNYKLMHHGKVCEDCKGHRYYKAVMNRCHKNNLIASATYSFETYFNSIAKKYSNNITKFISPSKFLKNKFIEFGWSASQIEYIPNFIDYENYQTNYNPGKYFLYIGRLSNEKGISTLINAFKGFSNKHSKLYIVGDGPMGNYLKSLSKHDDRISFTGYLSGNKLKEITRNALFIVVPSEWYENAPLSVLEAFSFGKPVIGADIGGLPEMIEDGRNGFHFKSGDVNQLKAKLELVMNLSDTQIREMGVSARRKVEKEYNSETHFKKLMRLYAYILR